MCNRALPTVFCLMLLLPAAMLPAGASQKADLVRVSKSESKLYLLNKGKAFAVFPVALGREPQGPKQREGDHRTPEGRYLLDAKNDHSRFYKAIHISYPSPEDQARAAKLGAPPGGEVMIHGQRNGFGWLESLTQRFNWTNGCIALRDEDLDVVWDSVDLGTPIEIDP
jgi:murein L,D-transpeptidase YafK